jgi:hypothetical protein
MRNLLWLALATSVSLVPAQAQVRQATPEDTAPPPSAGTLKEVPSPMLIDIPLGASTAPNGKPRVSLNESKPGMTRGYTDASGYVCDKARVTVVLVRREEHGNQVTIDATPALSTDYLRQDVNLTVALMSQGKEVRRQFWDHLTIGASKGGAVTALNVFAMGIGTSHPKAPTAHWEMSKAEWDGLWKDASPTLRVIVDIQE